MKHTELFLHILATSDPEEYRNVQIRRLGNGEIISAWYTGDLVADFNTALHYLYDNCDDYFFSYKVEDFLANYRRFYEYVEPEEGCPFLRRKLALAA